MENIRIKRIDSLSILKTLSSVCGVSGLIVGIVKVFLGGTFKNYIILKGELPKITMNGKVIESEVLPSNFWLASIRIISNTMIHFLVIAIVITLFAVLFNIISRFTGGINISIERE